MKAVVLSLLILAGLSTASEEIKIDSVLVTGANRGLGLEFVRQFSQLEDPPSFIFATFRNASTLQNLKAIQDSSNKSRVILIRLDVRDLDEIESAKQVVEETVGERGLSLLINNAGVLEMLEFPQITPENMELHFRTNTIGPVMVLQAFLPLLKKAAAASPIGGFSASKAAVISLSSMTASIQITGVQFQQDLIVPGYKISKAGLNMAMRIIAAKVKDADLLVVNIEPGWVRTDMGGPEADLDPQESVGDMIRTFGQLNGTHHGSYVNRFGQKNPY